MTVVVSLVMVPMSRMMPSRSVPVLFEKRDQ
jgi:hypothetical protein